MVTDSYLKLGIFQCESALIFECVCVCVCVCEVFVGEDEGGCENTVAAFTWTLLFQSD